MKGREVVHTMRSTGSSGLRSTLPRRPPMPSVSGSSAPTTTHCRSRGRAYGQGLGEWIAKGAAEAARGSVVVMFVPSRTDTRWFHDHVYGKAEVRFLRGRVRFVGATQPAPFPSMLVIFRPGAA